MYLNVASIIEHSARRHPLEPAFAEGTMALSYAELLEAVQWFAGVLAAKGIGPGSRVAIMLPNACEYPITFYAVQRVGAVAVPLNSLLRAIEIRHVLRDSGASLLVTTRGASPAREAAIDANVGTLSWAVRPTARSVVLDVEENVGTPADLPKRADRMATDDSLLLYTSGTTGKPKGVRLSHSSVMWLTEIMATRVFDIRATDVTLGALPLSHIFGLLAVMNVSMLGGCSVALMPRFEPHAAMDVIRRNGVTVFEGVPAMCSALVDVAEPSGEVGNQLRLAFLGGQSSPIELLRAFKAKFGCPVIECYGTTETGSSIAATSVDDEPEKVVGTVGRPLWGVDIQLRDTAGEEVDRGEVGEIHVRSPGNMSGYHDREEDTRRTMVEGYVATGDLGQIDENGNLRIVDRIKEMIIRGGYNVYPREVEEVIYTHPGVREAAVVAIPDERLGQEIAAVVALKRGQERYAAQDILEWVRERVAAYKYPRVIHIVEEVPKNATGKISKKSIDLERLSHEQE